VPGLDPFDRHAEQYDAWFERHPHLYASELRALRALMPRSTLGIEIGVGTGRFALPLGIHWGADASVRMLEMAKARGLKSVSARAEVLPFKASRFDLVLFVTTLCFLEDVETALGEANRVLRCPGTILIGMFDRDSPLWSSFIREIRESIFFREARFYSVELVTSLMRRLGFNQFEYCQTLGRPLIEIRKVEPVEKGYGEGLFAVIKASK